MGCCEWRVEAAPKKGVPNMVNLFATECSLPSVLFSVEQPLGWGCVVEQLARDTKMCFPSSEDIAASATENQGRKRNLVTGSAEVPNQPWFPELMDLLVAPPWPIPLRRDLLSQAGDTIWHPRPELWDLHVCQISAA